MHSKVIVASLVCVLASNFGNWGSVHNNKQTAKETVQETGCAAPNDVYGEFENQYCSFAAGQTCYIWYDTNEMISDFTVLETSYGLDVSIESLEEYGCETRFVMPTSPGEYYAVFGKGFKEIARAYLYSDGTCVYFSGHSMDAARSRYFFEQVATPDELDYLSDYDDIPSIINSAPRRMSKSMINGDSHLSIIADSGIITKPKFPKDVIVDLPLAPKTYELTKFDAQKHFSDFVFGDSDDIYTSVDVTRRSGSNIYDDVQINVYAEWYDGDGNSHPLKGIKTDILSPLNTSLVGEGAPVFTDDNGAYTAFIPYSQAKNFYKDEVQLRLSAISRATYVQDSRYLSYPYCFSNKGNIMTMASKLYNYSKIDFHVSIYPGRSDRANAYEICQAQSLPYEYCSSLGNGIDAVRTEYPASYSEYKDFRQQAYIIRVNEDDFNNWDLLNHEYGHYISDKYQIAHYFQEKIFHNVFDNLIQTYNEYDGPVLAFSEGLATYFAIASQKYSDPGSTIPGVADEVYEDAKRSVYVDYTNYSPASGHTATLAGECIEANITSFLLKMRDNTSRPGDAVALGDQEMWNLLTSGISMYGGYNPYTTVGDFIDYAISHYPTKESGILNLAGLDNITYVPPPPVTYDPVPSDVWTVLFYICGANLQKHAIADIKEMVKAKGQPNDVNIVLEIGGSPSWPDYDSSISFDPSKLNRYYIEGNQLRPLPAVPKANMGATSTFENFLDWGLTQFPAKKTGVVLWNHGGGLGGVCFDNNYSGDGLDSVEMCTAIQNVFGSKGLSQKLEFVGYDACLMQLQDVAEFNSSYFKHMVASEETIPYAGWKYDGWLPTLYEKAKTPDIMKKICTTYIDNGLNFNTLSHLNLSYMNTYRNKFETLASEIAPTVMANKEKFLMVFYKIKAFNYGKSGISDGWDFLNKLKADSKFSGFKNRIEEVKNAYKNLVTYNKTGWWFTGEAHGLAIYTGFNFDGYQKYDYDANLTHFTNWRNLVDQVTSTYDKNALIQLILNELHHTF